MLNHTIFVVTFSKYYQLFSKMVVPIYTSLFSSWELQLLHILTSIDSLFPHFSHFDVCAVDLHCVLNFKASKLVILKYVYLLAVFKIICIIKCPVKYFIIFSVILRRDSFLLTCRSLLQSLRMSPLLSKSISNVCFLYVACIFTLLTEAYEKN